MERGILNKLKRKTRQQVKFSLQHSLAEVRRKAASEEAKKLPERYHGDERIQTGCRDDFASFSDEVVNLGHKFEQFMRAIRPIGSSSGLVFTSKDLQNCMDNVLDAFRSNSAEIWRAFSSRTGNTDPPNTLQGSSAPAMPLLPEKMSHLKERLSAFLDGLRDIPEFSDKRLTDSLLEFRDWLEYRVECFECRRDSFTEESTAARWYISQAMKEMSVYARKVGVALDAFTAEGVKAIQGAQERSQTKLQNMSTVATFFSGVTATTMQYTINTERCDGVVDFITHTEYCLGHQLATCYALESGDVVSIFPPEPSKLIPHYHLGLTFDMEFHSRSPRSALPIWASVCLDHTPLLCLVGAVLAFFTGLVVWTFAADLALPVKVCAATMTCATSLILFTVIIWEAGEWWQEHKKALPTLTDIEPIAGMPPALHYLWQPWKSTKKAASSARTTLSAVLANTTTTLGQKWQQCVCFVTRRPSPDPLPFSLPQGNRRRKPADLGPIDRSPRRSVFAGHTPVSMSYSGEVGEGLERGLASMPGTATSGQFPFNRRRDAPGSLMRKVSPSLAKFQKAARTLVKNPSLRTSLQANQPKNSRPRRDELQGLQPAHALLIDHPTGRDIHFSPDGARLAISMLDGNLAIWDVGKYEENPQLLPSPVGRFAWSPDSSHIVIIKTRGLYIWNQDSGWTEGESNSPIGVVTWLQNASNFLAVIDHVPHIFNTEGKVTRRLDRLPLQVRDLASVPHKKRTCHGFILVLGTVLDDVHEWSSSSFLTRTQAKRPKDAIAEHLLMVIDVDGTVPSTEAVLLADARHICVSREGSFALVSYGNGDFPQLWQIQDRIGTIQLELCRKARFCGESDEWVMATNGISEIYIWDRAMGHPLHTLQASQISSKWPNYGGISAATSKIINDYNMNLTVVSTCTNGGVVVWECPDQAESQPNTPDSGPSRRETVNLAQLNTSDSGPSRSETIDLNQLNTPDSGPSRSETIDLNSDD